MVASNDQRRGSVLHGMSGRDAARPVVLGWSGDRARTVADVHNEPYRGRLHRWSSVDAGPHGRWLAVLRSLRGVTWR